MFSDVCGNGKIGKDMFRMSLDGTMAVKTAKGYKAYDVNKHKMTKVGDFALPMGEDTFFLMPTRKLAEGDIVIIDNQPVCVLAQNGEEVKFLTYDKAVVETRMIENIMFFGRPIYGKVVSMFSLMFKKADNEDSMMRLIMMSQMFSGNSPFGVFGGNQQANGPFGQLMPMLMMSQLLGGGGCGLFDAILGKEDSDEDEQEG